MKYIRKSGLIFLFIVVSLIVLLNIFLTDKWLENQLEKAGSNIVGAKVEIDNLDVSIFKGYIKWQRIQITHPQYTMKNMIETGPVEFKISIPALLKRKFVIENMHILNIKTFTDRKTDGRLPKKPEEKPKEPSFFEQQFAYLMKEVSSAPAFEFVSEIKNIKPEEIINQANLQTPQKIDSLRNVFTSQIENVKKEIENIENDFNTLKSIEANLKTINVSGIKTIDDLKRTYETVNGAIKQINELKEKYRGKDKQVKEILNSFNESKRNIESWVKEDFARVKDFAKLPEISTFNVVKYLLGPKILSYYLTYLDYSNRAERIVNKLQSVKPEKEKRPPRLKGQDIHFVKEKALPDFWLKNCAISGETNAGFYIKGEIKNVTSQPQVLGLPTTVEITGDRPDKAKLNLFLLLDLASSPSKQNLKFSILNFPIVNFNFGHDVKYLPAGIKTTTGNVVVELSKFGADVNSSIKFLALNPNFDYKSVNFRNEYERMVDNIIKNTFSSLKQIDANVYLAVKDNKVSVNFNSSLDVQLTNGFKQAIGREVEEIKRKLENLVRERVEKYRVEFERQIDEKIKELNNKLESYNIKVAEVENLRNIKLQELDKEIKKRSGNILERIFK